MTTVVIVDAAIIAAVCCSTVSGRTGVNFGFRVGVFCLLCSWSRVILGAVSIYLAWNKVIMCLWDGCCDLFSNGGNVNKDRYNGGCGDNDGNGRGGAADIFVTLAMFAIESIFAEQKKAMENCEWWWWGFISFFLMWKAVRWWAESSTRMDTASVAETMTETMGGCVHYFC